MRRFVICIVIAVMLSGIGTAKAHPPKPRGKHWRWHIHSNYQGCFDPSPRVCPYLVK